jgi:hypothetical protein
MDKAILHVGCGESPLPEWLSHFKETRLDINHDCKPCNSKKGANNPIEYANKIGYLL